LTTVWDYYIIPYITERINNMEWVLLIVILGIVAMGVWVAKHNQQFIDEQNQRYREEKKND
jgi:cell division protein FtsL